MIVHEVEQRSEAWYALRAGKPTASEFSKIITSKGEPSKSAAGYALTLAAEMFAGRAVDAWEGNQWTERGREMEARAISLYEFARDARVVPVGFVTDDSGGIGCSPDGFIGDDGLVEIKALKAEHHIKAILYHRKYRAAPPDYIQQTQGQLMICERAWCDLVFFHPVLPLLIVRQVPRPEIQAAIRRELPLVCEQRDAALVVLREMAAPECATDPPALPPVPVE